MSLPGYALVTGAGSGLGRGVALAFAASGSAGVVFADIDLQAAEQAAASSKTVCTHPEYLPLALQIDVTVEKDVDQMVETAVSEFGRIDYGVNCAGIGVRTPASISESSVPEFQRFLDVNVFGMFLCTRALSRVMKTQSPRPVSESNPRRGETRGAIVNMGSCSSFVATPMLGQYTTSKHAVLGLTRNAALDNAPHSIRVNCLCPSWVDTPMVSAAVAGNPALQTLMDNAVPMGRIAQVDEIADVALFLCSDRASYVTGSSWIVDGGVTLSGVTTQEENADVSIARLLMRSTLPAAQYNTRDVSLTSSITTRTKKAPALAIVR
ncbi:MAG: hypothetical protein L6R39_001783 [Caloplaca ligustica]|nr:MAG: hypothetical protein L6R39_001783 [Caloplaca ligustica]